MDALKEFLSQSITEGSIQVIGDISRGLAANLIARDLNPDEAIANDVCYANAKRLGFEYVYVFKGTHKGLNRYKVGKARNIEDRRSIFAVKLPFDIELAAAFFVQDAYKLEKDLHREHKCLCVGGEWFDLSPSAFDAVCRRGIARELTDYCDAIFKTVEYSNDGGALNDEAYIKHLEALLVMNGISFDRRRLTGGE